MFRFLRSCLFSAVAAPLYISPAVYERHSFSAPSPAFGFITVFYSGILTITVLKSELRNMVLKTSLQVKFRPFIN